MFRKSLGALPIVKKAPPKPFKETKVGKTFTKLLSKRKWNQ